MKKILLITVMLFAFQINAQQNYFTLTINGFENTYNLSQNYIVINFNGKTKQELYNDFLTELTITYVSSKDVISKSENNAISINALSLNAIKYKIGKNVSYFDLNYNLSFQFKDNKVRINLPAIVYMTRGANNLLISGSNGFLTNSKFIYKKGKLKVPSAKASLEKYFNGLINEIITSVKNKSNSDW
jgi:hypothetical protein